jgi:hypothetical protein
MRIVVIGVAVTISYPAGVRAEKILRAVPVWSLAEISTPEREGVERMTRQEGSSSSPPPLVATSF